MTRQSLSNDSRRFLEIETVILKKGCYSFVNVKSLFIPQRIVEDKSNCRLIVPNIFKGQKKNAASKLQNVQNIIHLECKLTENTTIDSRISI